MNMNRIIQMVLRILVAKAVHYGLKAGINAASGRSRGRGMAAAGEPPLAGPGNGAGQVDHGAQGMAMHPPQHPANDEEAARAAKRQRRQQRQARRAAKQARQ